MGITEGSHTTDAGDFLKDPGAAGRASLTEGGTIDAAKLADWLRTRSMEKTTSDAKAAVYLGLAVEIEKGWRP